MQLQDGVSRISIISNPELILEILVNIGKFSNLESRTYHILSQYLKFSFHQVIAHYQILNSNTPLRSNHNNESDYMFLDPWNEDKGCRRNHTRLFSFLLAIFLLFFGRIENTNQIGFQRAKLAFILFINFLNFQINLLWWALFIFWRSLLTTRS